MEQLLSKLAKIEAKVHSLRKACKDNRIGIGFLNGFNIKKMREIYSRLEKHYHQNPEKGKALWFQSELKLFNWVLISHSLVNCKKIQNFVKIYLLKDEQDWLLFKRIFPGKDIYTFKYESKKLLHKDSKNQRLWNSDEDEILTSILHGKWAHTEDLIILKYVISSGKKWSNISKDELPHRTEHMIKNRFKSLISRFQKTQDISEDNEKLCIELIINKLQNQSQQDLDSENHVKEEEIEMSEQSEPIQSFSAQVKSERGPEMMQNVIISETEKFQSLKTNKELPVEEIKNCQMASAFTPIESCQYSFSPTVFSFYYQPSLVCFPMGNCWNLFSPGYGEMPVGQKE